MGHKLEVLNFDVVCFERVKDTKPTFISYVTTFKSILLILNSPLH